MTQQNLFQEIETDKVPIIERKETKVQRSFEGQKKIENPFGIDRIINGNKFK